MDFNRVLTDLFRFFGCVVLIIFLALLVMGFVSGCTVGGLAR